jgi:hypothetical protein
MTNIYGFAWVRPALSPHGAVPDILAAVRNDGVGMIVTSHWLA